MQADNTIAADRGKVRASQGAAADAGRSPADRKQLIYWAVTVIAPLIVMMIPTGETFTPVIRNFLAITLCAILIFAFETLPQMIPAILLPVAYVVAGIAPEQAVFGPWSTSVPWMFMGGILMANCLESAGLLRRVAYWCIIKTGGTYNRILYGIMFTGIILNLLIPAQAVIPLAAFTYGICLALDLGQSKESAGIMLTGAMAALTPLFFFYNPNFNIIVGAGNTVYNEPMTWFLYLFHNAPMILWSFFCVFLITKIFKPSKEIDCKAYVSEAYDKLGSLTSKEKKGLFVTILLVIFLMTGGLHRINIGWGFAVAGCLMYLPGIRVGTDDDIKRINFSLLFFVTACMAIGAASNVLGIGKIIAQYSTPVMEASGSMFTLVLVWVLSVVSNFIMTPLAIWAAFTAPLAEIALSVDINPFSFYYIINMATNQIILPYEYALVLIYFSFGLIRLQDFVKFFSIKMIFNLIFIVIIMIPYWKFIGLI
jgi:di/tricarboxylate transporter